MDVLHNETPFFLKLPDEILDIIFKLHGNDDRRQAGRLRLTCRRFWALCHHYVIHRDAYVDISNPATLERLQIVMKNPSIATKIRGVYVRLHFYQPWMAKSFENFVTSTYSEWHQKRQDLEDARPGPDGSLRFEAIMKGFYKNMADLPVISELGESNVTAECSSETIDLPTVAVLRRAYVKYKSGFDLQDKWLRDGRFVDELVDTLAKLPLLCRCQLYDGELNNNWNPGTRVQPIAADDVQAQHDALVGVLSRPMLWEEARWVQPSKEIWNGVPVQLMVDIPIALGRLERLDYVYIGLSAAPDFAALALDEHKLDQLTLTMEKLDLFQFTFQPTCRSGCGPWEFVSEGEKVYAVRTEEEMERLNQYLGAFVQVKCLEHIDINLGEFWFSAGLDNKFQLACSVGASASWERQAQLMSLELTDVCLTVEELELLVKTLDVEARFCLWGVCLREGTWCDALDILRREIREPQHLAIQHVSGGEVDDFDYQEFEALFRPNEGPSMVEQYVRGEDMRNPLARGD